MDILNQSDKIINFQEAFEKMIQMVEKIKQNQQNETLWLLQHQDVYTIGKSGNESDIIDKNANFCNTNRGGKITFHGKGQLVAYFMLDVKKRFFSDVRKYIQFLQECVVQTLAKFEIKSSGDVDLVGVWVEGEKRQKIASIGVRISSGISYHGVAININTELEKFNKIIPCGISDFKTCSTKSLGFDINLEDFAQQFAQISMINLEKYGDQN